MTTIEVMKDLSNAYLSNTLMAISILVVGYLLALILKFVSRRLFKSKNNQIFKKFLGNIIYTLILILTIVTALSKLGVPTASLIAVMGAASLAIGFALRDSLANIAAGFLIVFLKVFKIGDFVEINGNSGTVVDINLFLTQLKTSGNETVFVPNNKVITNSVINNSFYDARRFDLIVGVAYAADLIKAKKVIMDMLQNSSVVIQDPQPIVGVKSLDDSAVTLLIRVWLNRDDAIIQQMNLLEQIKEVLQKNDVEIPFPQLDVNVTSSKNIGAVS
jgi:small conductance mechanosensitive channel